MNEITKIKNCAGKEAFQRINYLYQISNDLVTHASTHKSSCFYTNLMVNISKKSVQRMSIDMKRSICKHCRCILLAGITGKVRIKKKKLQWTCLKCSTMKKFNLNPNYQPWTLQAQSVCETLNYSRNKTPNTYDEKN